ncbi:MAG: hypothetical protein ACO1N5_05120 [Noviherbaspirillum sp.]
MDRPIGNNNIPQSQENAKTPLFQPLVEAHADYCLNRLVYTKNSKATASDKLERKIAKLKLTQDNSVKTCILTLRTLRNADAPYINAYIENYLRNIRDRHSANEALEEGDFSRGIEEAVGFAACPPVLDDKQIEKISLGEFTDGMGGMDPTDREKLREYVFRDSPLLISQQKKCIWKMADFVETYRDADQKTRNSMLERLDPRVEQFCIHWMDAIDQGVKLNALPGCGVGIQRLVETISPPAPKIKVPPPAVRKRLLVRQNAQKENPQKEREIAPCSSTTVPLTAFNKDPEKPRQ